MEDEPKIGDVRIFKHRQQVFKACAVCGNGRWVTLVKGKPRNSNHQKCSLSILHKDSAIQDKRKSSIKKSWGNASVRKNHSNGQKERWSNPQNRRSQKQKMVAWHSNPNNKQRLRQSLIAWRSKPETIEKMRIGLIKQYSNPSVHKKHSASNIKRYKDPNERERSRQQTLKRYTDPIERLKTGAQSAKRWADSSYKDKTINAIFKGMNLKPNKPETLLMNILNEHFPNEWMFTGDGKCKIKIKHKLPDFVHISNKWVIEHFGSYIHTTLARKYHQTEKGRIELFAEANYKTLVLWDITELNKNLALEKIKKFFYSENE